MEKLRNIRCQVEANAYEAGRRGMIFVGCDDFTFRRYEGDFVGTLVRIFLYYKEKNDSYYFFAKGNNVFSNHCLKKVKEHNFLMNVDDPLYMAVVSIVNSYNERVELEQAACETEKESERSKSL